MYLIIISLLKISADQESEAFRLKVFPKNAISLNPRNNSPTLNEQQRSNRDFLNIKKIGMHFIT